MRSGTETRNRSACTEWQIMPQPGLHPPRSPLGAPRLTSQGVLGKEPAIASARRLLCSTALFAINSSANLFIYLWWKFFILFRDAREHLSPRHAIFKPKLSVILIIIINNVIIKNLSYLVCNNYDLKSRMSYNKLLKKHFVNRGDFIYWIFLFGSSLNFFYNGIKSSYNFQIKTYLESNFLKLVI
jgi:hypothetical protein